MSDITRAEVCAVACAEAFRGDGEILASPMALVPSLGARLARETFEPDLLLSDGEATFVEGPWALGAKPPATTSAWIPYRSVFDIVWNGHRHVMMGASQIDRHGNQNIACIGEWARPKAQLLGVRGAPGNTVNHPTSYWVPNHSTRVFVEHVDFVSGVGYPSPTPFHEIRRVVSSKGVFDFETPDRTMRLRSFHPGVSVDEIAEATGFPLVVDASVEETRPPTDEELRLIRQVLDPGDLRGAEVR